MAVQGQTEKRAFDMFQSKSHCSATGFQHRSDRRAPVHEGAARLRAVDRTAQAGVSNSSASGFRVGGGSALNGARCPARHTYGAGRNTRGRVCSHSLPHTYGLEATPPSERNFPS